MAFIIVVAVILIKYTPQYEVSIDGQKIGYVESQSDIDKYIDEEVLNQEGKNIAFVELKTIPTFKLELVDRNIESYENILKREIADQVSIQYTNYAISINGENQTYVATMEEAEKIVKKIKKDYVKKYTKNLGIVQVYSDDYSKIASVDTQKAQSTVAGKLKSAKKADDIKIAKANKAKEAKLAASTPATKVTKVSNVNGVKFTVRPVSGTITSRFGRRSSPGGIGSTNHKGLDIAASEFYNGSEYYLKGEGKTLSTELLIKYYLELIDKYPIISIEDPFEQNDWEGFSEFTNVVGDKIQIVGDDLFVTNKKYLQEGIKKSACNAILIKLNQVGTVSEAIETIKLAREHGYKTIISHRSGETEDTIIADLAVGLSLGQIKTGSLSRSERIAKYNRLLRVEEQLYCK